MTDRPKFWQLLYSLPGNLLSWVLAWFDSRAFNAGNGVSLGRRLAAFVVICLTMALVYDAVKRGISAPWAATASALTGSLQLLWVGSKFKAEIAAKLSPSVGAKEEP